MLQGFSTSRRGTNVPREGKEPISLRLHVLCLWGDETQQVHLLAHSNHLTQEDGAGISSHSDPPASAPIAFFSQVHRVFQSATFSECHLLPALASLPSFNNNPTEQGLCLGRTTMDTLLPSSSCEVSWGQEHREKVLAEPTKWILSGAETRRSDPWLAV